MRLRSMFIFSALALMTAKGWAESFSAKDVLIGQKTFVCKFYGTTAEGLSLPGAKRGEISIRARSALEAAVAASSLESPAQPVESFLVMRVRIRGVDYNIVSVECD